MSRDPQTTKGKLGAARHFKFGSPNNPIMWACAISIKAAGDNWTTGDFEKIVKEIQAEAYDAGVLATVKVQNAG